MAGITKYHSITIFSHNFGVWKSRIKELSSLVSLRLLSLSCHLSMFSPDLSSMHVHPGMSTFLSRVTDWIRGFLHSLIWPLLPLYLANTVVF